MTQENIEANMPLADYYFFGQGLLGAWIKE